MLAFQNCHTGEYLYQLLCVCVFFLTVIFQLNYYTTNEFKQKRKPAPSNYSHYLFLSIWDPDTKRLHPGTALRPRHTFIYTLVV